VGYGADPVAVLELIEGHAERGAIVVRGNHDAAALGENTAVLNSNAEAAMQWTRAQLGARQRRFLSGLPLSKREDELLFVHASAEDPASWRYVSGPVEAEQSMRASTASFILSGHVHEQHLYYAG